VLAWEAGRKYGMRVNTISAGPLASRAAIAIKKGAPGERNYIDYCIDYNMANSVCVFFFCSLFFLALFWFSSAEQLLCDRREMDISLIVSIFFFFLFFWRWIWSKIALFLSPSESREVFFFFGRAGSSIKSRSLCLLLRAGSREVFFFWPREAD
jgi:hypothetical protein